jgi:hypothetical protein
LGTPICIFEGRGRIDPVGVIEPKVIKILHVLRPSVKYIDAVAQAKDKLVIGEIPEGIDGSVDRREGIEFSIFSSLAENRFALLFIANDDVVLFNRESEYFALQFPACKDCKFLRINDYNLP